MSRARPLPTKTQALVVGVRAFKEADRMVDLLTPDHGRITAIARIARRSQRRFGGALDVGNRVEASLRRPRAELWGQTAAPPAAAGFGLSLGSSRTQRPLRSTGTLFMLPSSSSRAI